MGLGPPVCTKCWVVGELTDKHINGSSWKCPICESRDLDEHLFDCGKSHEELKDNEKFLRFVLNKYDK